MENLSIIGSSKIAEEHIKSAIRNRIKILCVYTTNPKSKNILNIQKKYKIDKIFYNFEEFLNFSKKNNSHFLICARIKDNKKILIKCLTKTKSKIMIEKPIFINPKNFGHFYKFNNRIFCSYNRVYYENIKLLKKKISNKKNNLLVICPEKNRKSIVTNSCHIISIFLYIFKKLKVKIINTNSQLIEVYLYNKKNQIHIIFSFNNNENFKIETLNKKNKIILSPIENMKIFNGLDVIFKNNIRLYRPKKVFEINEQKFSNNCKPGFFNQMKEFKLFIKNNKKIISDLKFGHEIIKICNKIIKKNFNTIAEMK